MTDYELVTTIQRMVTRRSRGAKRPIVAIGYVRMSTSKQDLSPSAQGAALDAWALREGAQLIAVYCDLGVSGTTDLDERPGLAAALASFELHRATVLVAAKEDRLARDSDIAGYIATMARRAGASVVTADGGTDLFRRDIDRAFAAEEARRIQGRTRAALAVKRARGERLGGQVPYGMQPRPDGAHVLRDGYRRCAPECTGCLHLEPSPVEQAVISAAKSLSETGLSVRAIAAALNDAGHRNRAGKPFAHQSVYDFLRPLLA